jgi:hypothetical protein
VVTARASWLVDNAVLLAVSPIQRAIEIVCGCRVVQGGNLMDGPNCAIRVLSVAVAPA